MKTTRWAKCEFHCHSREDPKDKGLRHSAEDLIIRAQKLGFDFVALTLHEKVHLPEELREFADAREILMVPSCELSVQGRDVLAINCPHDLPQRAETWEGLVEFKKSPEGRDCLLIAPHPLYVIGGSMGRRRLVKYSHIFDAFELCHLRTTWMDPNKRVVELARSLGKPMVATSDAHGLKSFGRWFCQVEIPDVAGTPKWENIRAGVLRGAIRQESKPLPTRELLRTCTRILIAHFKEKLLGK